MIRTKFFLNEIYFQFNKKINVNRNTLKLNVEENICNYKKRNVHKHEKFIHIQDCMQYLEDNPKCLYLHSSTQQFEFCLRK